MPEKGWYSLTVRAETARRVREMAGARGLVVDQLVNELLTPALKGGWLTRACVEPGSRLKTCLNTWQRFIREQLEHDNLTGQ